MNFFFKFVDGPRKPWEGEGFADQLGEMLAAADHPRYRRCRVSSAADFVILVEPCEYKDWRYLKVIQADPDLRQRPNDCFAINYDDDAVGFLAGCYAGLRKSRFDPKRHRATCYLHSATELAERFARRAPEVRPKHLLSFRGAASHPVRDKLFAQKERWKEFGPITRVDRWFDHTEQEQEDYLQEIIESRFVLCPRGIAPATHRLFEVIQSGRVPVILSDAWVTPEGPAWSAFSIRVAESEVEQIPEILRARREEADAMGRRARLEWEQWFSPPRRMITAMAAIEDLIRTRPAGHDEAVELQKWRTAKRRWQMGWTLPQRVVRKIAGH